MSLKDKVVVITGASKGIGRAIALRFAPEGARLALVARSASQIAELAEEIQSAGGTAVALPTDITSEEQVQALAERTEAELGPVDVLVNNAGIFLLRSLAETTLEEWEAVLNTNLRGAFLCCRAFLPSMMRRKTGRIINVSSSAARQGYAEQGAYCVSKHGLNGLSKVLALEAKPYGIRVNVVSPGGVLTDLSAGLRRSRGNVNESEWMTAEEVAEAVYYVATQEGAATTDELKLRRFASDPWRTD